MKRLLPDSDLWIDAKNKRVVMDGVVCLNKGSLEMFACLLHTKEHESIVAVDTKAHAVHAALIAVGAKPGTPVQYRPEFKPPTGTEIDIAVIWTDDKGKVHHERAQEWVRDVKTGKVMQSPWVFAGSGIWKDETTGKEHYMAEGGDFICVSNFPSAMLDIPVESTDTNAGLVFDAFTDHIPPVGTRVRLVLAPKLNADKAKADAAKQRSDYSGGLLVAPAAPAAPVPAK
jgi:hypothetical protein